MPRHPKPKPPALNYRDLTPHNLAALLSGVPDEWRDLPLRLEENHPLKEHFNAPFRGATLVRKEDENGAYILLAYSPSPFF